MKNKTLQHVSNIFWENYLSAHNRHTKFFFAVDVAKKNIKISQLFLKAENNDEKTFFSNPKQEMSGNMIKSQKKINFRSLQAFLT